MNGLTNLMQVFPHVLITQVIYIVRALTKLHISSKQCIYVTVHYVHVLTNKCSL